MFWSECILSGFIFKEEHLPHLCLNIIRSSTLMCPLIYLFLCRLVVLRHWFAQCSGPETEKTSQNQLFVPCVTSHHDTRTPRWRRMLSDCTTACLSSSNCCIRRHTGHSSRYTDLLEAAVDILMLLHLAACFYSCSHRCFQVFCPILLNSRTSSSMAQTFSWTWMN